MKRGWLIGWILAVIVVGALYALVIRHEVMQAYQNQPSAWMQLLIDWLYPRFWVERQRFELSFFLQRADQVIFRLLVVNGIAWVFTALWMYSAPFSNAVTRFWDQPVSLRQVRWLRILFFAGILFFTRDWWSSLSTLHEAAAFYRPLPLLRLAGIGFPSPITSVLLWGLLVTSCLLVMGNVRPVFFSGVAAGLFVLLQAWLQSFEKMDHTFAPLTYAVLLMPFLLHQAVTAKRQSQPAFSGWSYQLICVSIALVYFLSGMEKLMISGGSWLNPDSFRNYLFLHQTPLGLRVSKSDVWCTLLPLAALLFQLGFAGMLFFPRLRMLFIPAGIGFHAGTYWLLGVGWYVNPWIFTYIFFIHWDNVAQRVHRLVTAKHYTTP